MNATPPSAAERLRVLVIDDNHDSADGLCRLLALWGHDARAAYDGEQGLRLAAITHPHCVLMDLSMPGLTGFEVARRMRRDPGLAGSRVVAVTAHSEEVYRKLAAEAGFDAYLVKPASAEEICATLQAAEPAVAVPQA